MIIYGISAFHRPKCETARTLLSIGVEPSRIYLQINAKEDVESYSAIWDGKIDIHFADADCVAGNRNRIISATEGDLVLLDDDIRSFKKLDPNIGKYGRWNRIESAEELEAFIQETFDKARGVRASIWGASPLDQSKQRVLGDGAYSLNKNFQGGFCGIVDKCVRYDENYKLQDDYELNVRLISQGKRILRRNDLYANKGKMAGNDGGCKEMYEQGLQPYYLRKLECQYPSLFKANKDMKGGRLLNNRRRH